MVPYGGETYFIAEFLLQRGIAVVYFFAFLVIYRQYIPLVGEKGLKPIEQFTKDKNFWEAPSIFYFCHKDRFIKYISLLGLILSLLGVFAIPDLLSPKLSIIFWLTIWLIFVSFRITGQEFWNQGAVLVETGFLAIFLGTIGYQSSEIMMWLFRWVLFRIMFNSGLTKLKGDKCWKNLTCLDYQFETQPFPGPLSRKLHFSPKIVKRIGIIFTWFAMLIIPWFYFFPQPYAAYAGTITMIYQIGIFISGNYSWLNISAITISFATISDQFIQLIVPVTIPEVPAYPYPDYALFLATSIAILSIRPTYEMLFTKFKEVQYGIVPIVNIYGKFAQVERKREEIIFEGKRGEDSDWKQYRLQNLPPKIDKRPNQHAPYYYRLDYALYSMRREHKLDKDWINKLVDKMLRNDEYVPKLLSHNPFKNKKPPKQIRLVKYHYEFANPGTETQENKYWKRNRKEVIKVISRD